MLPEKSNLLSLTSIIQETPSIDQNTEKLLLTEDKGTEKIPSTIITEQVSISTPISDVVDKQEATQGETATTEKPVCYILKIRFSILSQNLE